jgi:bifunctional non-homologous end joining protein LigD
MMATLVDEPFDDQDWIYEIKWDGYRAISSVEKGKVDLRSRNDISFTEKFFPVTKALEEWNVNIVVDGEIVAVDEQGVAQFQGLQSWQKTGEGTLVYYVFDILWLEGHSLIELPLVTRKEILSQLIPESDILFYSDHIVGEGKKFFEAAKEKGLEGIIAKNSNSSYQVAQRSKDWLKIKTTQRQEAVIAGYTAGRASRQHFGALILGVYEGDDLVYAGHTGSGFNQKTLSEIWNKLQPLVTNKCPFRVKPKTNMPATWVKPKLICEIKFQEWTQDNLMRQPIFMGLRFDKKPTEVKREKPMTAKKAKNKSEAEVKKSEKPSAIKKAKSKSIPGKKLPTMKKSQIKGTSENWLPVNEKDKTVIVDGKELKFTNLDKIYWKKEKYTKRDMLNYYHNITPYMLPYMKDRPQSLNRHPNGINGMSFYQKDVRGKVASWIETHADFSESNNETIEYFVCTNEASLLYLANLGCIEMNPWHSRTQTPDHPDYCLIDLDPHEIGFDKVIETAQTVKKVLDDLEIPGYCKTSGASGLHIYIPLGAKYDYDQSKHLAELIVTLVHHEIPSFTSLERSPQKRRRKIYLDYLQNRQSQTVAAPYSVRPKPGAPVSTPLHWEEVKKGLSPSAFTMKNIFDRLKREGDLFKPVLQKGIDLKKTLLRIESFLSIQE